MPLEKADAAAVAATLSQLFTRLNINPANNTQSQQGRVTTQTQQGTPPRSALLRRADPGAAAELPAGRRPAIAHEGRAKDIKHQDTDNTQTSKEFHLRKASAARVATLLNNFYSTRYSEGQRVVGQPLGPHHLRHERQYRLRPGGPGRHGRDRELDHAPGRRRAGVRVTMLRIKQLHYTAADDIANMVQRAISYGVAPYIVPTGTTAGRGDAGARGTPGGTAGAAPGGTPGGDAGRLPRAERRAATGRAAGRPAAAFPGTITPGATTTGAAATGAAAPDRDADGGRHHQEHHHRFTDPKTGKVIAQSGCWRTCSSCRTRTPTA